MKRVKAATVKGWVKDGRVECETDLKVGYVSIRWTRTGKSEDVEVIADHKSSSKIKKEVNIMTKKNKMVVVENVTEALAADEPQVEKKLRPVSEIKAEHKAKREAKAAERKAEAKAGKIKSAKVVAGGKSAKAAEVEKEMAVGIGDETPAEPNKFDGMSDEGLRTLAAEIRHELQARQHSTDLASRVAYKNGLRVSWTDPNGKEHLGVIARMGAYNARVAMPSGHSEIVAFSAMRLAK